MLVNNIPSMESARIEDDITEVETVEDFDNDRIISMFDDINREIEFQEGASSNLDTEQQDIKWKYPIESGMFQDLNYHARTCMFVNMHICPYQVRYGTDDKTPFIQYIMRKKNDRSQKENLHDHEYNYMDFHKKTFLDHHTINTNFYEESVNIMKAMLFCYRKNVNDTSKIKYKGFRKSGNDFYVFFDISDMWINHHYLNMHDLLWIVNMYELSVLNEVCSVPVSDDVVTFFKQNSDLVDIYYSDDTRVPIPVVGFTVEDKKQMDFTMTFGSCYKKYKDIDDSLVYYYDYRDCCDTINNEEKQDKIIMRHCIMYDKCISYDEYISLSDDVDKDRNIIVDNINDIYCGFVICQHKDQTPLSSHNMLPIA
jgi:hypothetical protein